MYQRTLIKPEWGLASLSQAADIKPVDGEFGVEFELEGTNLSAVGNLVNQEVLGKTPVWNAKKDGSLSTGGMEFVLAKPLDRHLAVEAIEELYYELEQKAKLDLSYRCSTHVHMNFSNMTINQIFLFLTLHYTLEEALFKVVAPARYNNNYCIPLVLCDGITEELMQVVLSQTLNSVGNGYKYKALNFNCLKTYGSLENRMKGGTSSAKDAINWLNVLAEMYDVAKNNERLTPDYFLQQFSGKGFQLYLQEFLPVTWNFIKDLPNLDTILNRGVWVAQDIAFALDWSPVINGTKPTKLRKTTKSATPPAFATTSWGSEMFSNSITIPTVSETP